LISLPQTHRLLNIGSEKQLKADCKILHEFVDRVVRERNQLAEQKGQLCRALLVMA
jgi:hypothetical protein